METSLEERIDELLHRLRIEAAVVAGAKNVIRILQNNKVPDKKALQEVSDMFQSLAKTCFILWIVVVAFRNSFRKALLSHNGQQRTKKKKMLE